jgi:hypothetical protein
MGHDVCRGAFLRRTDWVSHFLGLPSCFPPQLLCRARNSRLHPSGRVGASWFRGGSRYCVGLGVRSKMREGWEKTNHDFHRGSFLGRTGWASHFLGPSSYISLPNSSFEHEAATHIPLKGERRVQLASILGVEVLRRSCSGETRERQTNINRYVVDVEFKLRSSLKDCL